MKVKSLFFSPFPSCDGWFQPKVLSLPVKKISTVILINKCLDLAFATLMLERKKFKLHSGFFSIVLRRLGQSSCHSCIKKRNLTLGHYFPLFVWFFLIMKERLEHSQRLIWGLQQANWGWHRWECQELGKGKEMGCSVLQTSSVGFSLSPWF